MDWKKFERQVKRDVVRLMEPKPTVIGHVLPESVSANLPDPRLLIALLPTAPGVH